MLKNIISAAQNTGELAALNVASHRGITTGGWMPAEFKRRYWKNSQHGNAPLPQSDRRRLGLQEKQDATFAALDKANCRAADLTLLLHVANGEVKASVRQRQKRVWNCRSKGMAIEEAYLSIAESPRIRLLAYRRSVEVINVVCLQNSPDDSAASDMVRLFMDVLLESLGEITEPNGDAVWSIKRRRTMSGASFATKFLSTGESRFLSSALEYAEHCILDYLSDFRVDPALSRQVYDEARESTKQSLRGYVGAPLTTRRPAKGFGQIWLANTVCALNAVIPGLLTDRRLRKAQRGLVTPHTQRSVYTKLSRQATSAGSADGLQSQLLSACCAISQTRLREDRALRIWLLLVVGGAWAASPEVSRVLTRLKRSLQQLNRDFHSVELAKRLNCITFEETSGRLTVGGSRIVEKYKGRMAIQRIGKKMEHSWRTLPKDGPFKDLIQVRDHEQLEAELFYFVDQFRHDESLWTEKNIAGFAHGLCWLCGTDEANWRDWLCLPPEK